LRELDDYDEVVVRFERKTCTVWKQKCWL